MASASTGAGQDIVTVARVRVAEGRFPARSLALIVSLAPLLLLGQGFLLEKALDLALEMRLAAVWGASARRDMYLVASATLVPSAMMQMIVFPLIVDQRQRGADFEERGVVGALTLLSLAVTWAIAALALVVWWAAGAAGTVPAAEMAGATLAFVAAGFGMTLVSVAAAHRIADGRFDLASFRIPVIRAAMLAAAFVVPFGVAAPAAGALVASAALTAAIGGAGLVRWLGRPALQGLLPALALFVMNAYPMVPRLLIERPVLGAMGDGTLATLDYAEKTTLIAGLAGFAIVGVASTVLRGERWTYRRRAVLVAAVLVPVAIAVAALARPLVALLFERGEFDASDTASVTELTRLLAPSIPCVAAVPLLVPGIRGRPARRGVLLIAAGLLVHLLAVVYTYRTADARVLAVSFDITYAAIFAGFFALAGAGRRRSA